MSPPVSVTAILVSYRHGGTLPAALRSLEAVGNNLREVVVVDNAGDLGRSLADQPPGCRISLVCPGKNLGYAAAANLAAHRADGDLLLFLSPDAEIVDIDVQRLSELLAPPVVTAAAWTFAHDGTPAVSWGELPGIARMLRTVLAIRRMSDRRRLALLAAGAVVRVPWTLGAAIAVRKQVLDEIGGFEESYMLAGEDQDLGARVRDRGLLSVVTPVWKVRHEPRSPREPSMARLIRANDQKLVNRFGSTFDRLVWRLLRFRG